MRVVLSTAAREGLEFHPLTESFQPTFLPVTSYITATKVRQQLSRANFSRRCQNRRGNCNGCVVSSSHFTLRKLSWRRRAGLEMIFPKWASKWQNGKKTGIWKIPGAVCFLKPDFPYLYQEYYNPTVLLSLLSQMIDGQRNSCLDVRRQNSNLRKSQKHVYIRSRRMICPQQRRVKARLWGVGLKVFKLLFWSEMFFTQILCSGHSFCYLVVMIEMTEQGASKI